jgi:hypothetical protein
MSVEARDGHQPSNAYQIFILVLTVFSLLILVALVLPLNQATTQLLVVYDNLICVVFLIDFVLNLRWSTSKREYLIGRRGWLDLLGSIPAFGFFPYTALFRLARISRLARITRLLRGKNKKQLVGDVLRHRGQYAAFIRRGRAVVVGRDHQYGRLRGRVSRHRGGPDYCPVCHGRWRRHHRCPREHPGEHSGASAGKRRRPAWPARCGHTPGAERNGRARKGPAGVGGTARTDHGRARKTSDSMTFAPARRLVGGTASARKPSVRRTDANVTVTRPDQCLRPGA